MTPKEPLVIASLRIENAHVRLQRLAGFGPIAGFVSAGSLILFLFVGTFAPALVKTSPYAFLAIVFVIALWVWVAALAVLVFDLEWIEHPATSTRWFQIGRWATLVAVVMPAVLGLFVLVNAGVPELAPTYFLLYGSVGLSLLIHNLDARRASILRGVLPWLGMVTAVFYLLAGIGYAIYLFGGPFAIGWNSLQLASLLYVVWAIWLGIHLIRSKAPRPAASAAAARLAHRCDLSSRSAILHVAGLGTDQVRSDLHAPAVEQLQSGGCRSCLRLSPSMARLGRTARFHIRSSSHIRREFASPPKTL